MIRCRGLIGDQPLSFLFALKNAPNLQNNPILRTYLNVFKSLQEYFKYYSLFYRQEIIFTKYS
jgi:hypothetical protein